MRVGCSEHHSTKSVSTDSEQDHEVRLDLQAGGLAGVLKTVKSLITNGPYMFLLLYSTFDSIIVNGFIAFGAKYFQQQFGLTAAMAGIVFGQSFFSVMAVMLRYFTEFGNLVFRHVPASICGGIMHESIVFCTVCTMSS